MDATLRALGQILLQALPTFFLVIFLHFYLKSTFFKPLQQMLTRRREATEGARESAAESLRRAEHAAAEYERHIQAARNDLYREQEETRRRWEHERASEIEHARHRAAESVGAAKSELAAQAIHARHSLATNSQLLADQITETFLRRRPV